MNRNFKGIWIPAVIWLHQELSIQAKTLWAEIDSLYDEEKGGCYASDEYLMKFLGVRISRLHEIMKELRDLGLIEKVSFDGRNRIMKAILPVKSDNGNQPSGKPEPSLPENRNPEIRDSGTLTIYIENSLDSSIDTPLISPQKEPEVEVSAEADEVDLNKSSESKPKAKRTPSAFSPKIREVGQQIIDSILESKPTYVPPRNLHSLLTEVDFLLRLDKRDPQKIFDVLNWALSDPFWRDKMFKPNPAKYLREKFDQLEAKMEAKPEKKERKFAPSSEGKWKESPLYKQTIEEAL